MRLIALLALALLACNASAAEPVRYLSLINDSPIDIESIEISAPHAAIDGTVTERHPSLRDGETMTWGIQVDGQCLRDLLVTFDEDRRVIVRDLNICSDRVIHARDLYAAMQRNGTTRFDGANVAFAASPDARSIR